MPLHTPPTPAPLQGRSKCPTASTTPAISPATVPSTTAAAAALPAREKVLILTGPTAVGKSSTALSLCRLLGGEIISADSVQVYRHLDIASNKSPPHERAQAPHHLLDIADPGAPTAFTAGHFFRAAREATADVLARARAPVVVGGTMMYVRWYIHGRPSTPRPTAAARARAASLVAAARDDGDWARGVAVLAQRDAARAAALSPNDWYRLIRALEVVETAGEGVSALPQQGASPRAALEDAQKLDYDFRCFFLVGERQATCRVIDARCETMVWPRDDAGATHAVAEGSGAGSVLREVTDLLVSKRLRVAPDSPARAIGYRQTIAYLCSRALVAAEATAPGQERERLRNADVVGIGRGNGDDDDDDDVERSASVSAFRAFVDELQTATRNYAKQQIAWFRKDQSFHWVGSGPTAAAEIARLFALPEAEFRAEREQQAAAQAEMRADMVRQGKDMKRYVSERTWLVHGSEVETAAVRMGEHCARRLADAMDADELRRIMDAVGRGADVGVE